MLELFIALFLEFPSKERPTRDLFFLYNALCTLNRVSFSKPNCHCFLCLCIGYEQGFMLWWSFRWVQQFYSRICNQPTVPWPFFSKRRVVLSSQHVSSHWPKNYEGLALTSKKPIKQGRPNWKGWLMLKFWLQEEIIEKNKQYLPLKFMFSKKATKIDKIFIVDLTFSIK